MHFKLLTRPINFFIAITSSCLVCLQVFEGLSSRAEPGERSLFNARALEFYRRSVELDLSQTDILLRIGELMLTLPIEEHGKAT